MSDRPTPEQIASRDGTITGGPVHAFLVALEEHGYVIVHPDDMPSGKVGATRSFSDFDRGWNACRRHIFGEDS